MADNLEHLKDWIGKTESKSDVATAWPVAALAATFDRSEPEPVQGDAIPPGWHWLYFLEAKPPSELGPDGHPKRGGFLPPVPLPRRMWAGGRLDFRRPLYVGEALRRDSEILAVEPKHGKSGSLVFVTVRHTVFSGGELAVVEEHDIVYRDAAKAGDPAPQAKAAPASAQWRRELTPDAVMLFRFSALTFNGHRIHYDIDYAKHEEHYPGLIVHGPMQTLLMLDLCRRNDKRPVQKLDYRALHPVFHDASMTVNGNAAGDKIELWTANHAGSYAMTGTATL
ncbi:MAG TPA: MaoC family dehydratase N-terminal domain-containing protein [Burkholderiales bacterium]|jgi:3-methylfumaryl-CoA hydratase|nr:MaoC family dehydratase N-terminal domain-containing protein [Burkholderiales bacterium]